MNSRRTAPVSFIPLLFLSACGTEEPTLGICAVTLDGVPVRGPADAWVTLVEFADFQCPYCKDAVATVEQILTAYPDDVRHLFKHLPLSYHTRAMDAARAAVCAEAKGRFWEMHDAIYAHQDALTDADLERYANQVGIDLPTWQACLPSSSTRQRIDRDRDEAGRAGVRGTPTFFINRRVIRGAEPFSEFAEVIDAELAAAQTAGVARADYFSQVVQTGCAP